MNHAYASGLPAGLSLHELANGDRTADSVYDSRPCGSNVGPGERVIHSCIGIVILDLMLCEVADDELDAPFRSQVSSVLRLEKVLQFRS